MNRERALTVSWFLLRVVAGLMFFDAGALIVLRLVRRNARRHARRPP